MATCPTCRQRFSGDARFCPFDGERLQPSAQPDPPDPLVGTIIDRRYQVVQVLGEGGMGTVYRVRHTILGRQFALKVLKRELSSDPELPTRFIREAKAAAAISHPNVVQISDFGVLATEQPFFVMELLNGLPLSAIVWKSGPLRPERALPLLRQVAEGLAAAHAAGVIHRDLKPDNIHVSSSGGRDVVKVLDFGLAKVAGASRLTKNGIVYGTPHYMSPEQASGEPIDHRSDIYALGVVMYETLTGRVPFEAETYMGVLTKHLYETPDRPSRVLGEAAPPLGALEAITMRCLEKKPQKRYASMNELLLAFDRALGVRSPQARGAPIVPASFEIRSSLADGVVTSSTAVRPVRWPWAIVAVLAGAAASASTIALFTSGSAPSPSHPASAPAASVAAVATAPTGAVPRPEPSAAVPAALAAPGSAASAPDGGVARRAVPAKVRSSGAARRPPSESGTVNGASRSSGSRGGGEIVDPWAK